MIRPAQRANLMPALNDNPITPPNALSADWPLVALGDICRFINGDAYKPSDWSMGGVPIVRIQNLNDETKPFNYWAGSLDRRVILETGDVLLAWSGTPGTSFGAHLWNRGSAVLNQHIFRVDLDANRLLPEFAIPAINSKLETLIQKAHGGVGLQHVTKSEVERLQIPLPPLEMQERIAARLTAQMQCVAEAREAAARQLAAAKALPASYLRQAFDDAEAHGWKTRRIGDLVGIQSGYAFKSEWFSNEGVRLLRNINVLPGYISWIDVTFLPKERRSDFSSYELSEGDIVLSLDRPVISGGLKIARLTVADVPSLLLQRVARFIFPYGNESNSSLIEPSFLFAFLGTNHFIQVITQHDQSIGVPHVLPKQVADVQIPLPPLEVQKQVVERLKTQMDASQAAQRAAAAQLAALDNLPAAYLREVFSSV